MSTRRTWGEAAGETAVAALLIGLGVDELSVAPARLDELREAVRLLSFTDAAEAARQAVEASSARGISRDLGAARWPAI